MVKLQMQGRAHANTHSDCSHSLLLTVLVRLKRLNTIQGSPLIFRSYCKAKTNSTCAGQHWP